VIDELARLDVEELDHAICFRVVIPGLPNKWKALLTPSLGIFRAAEGTPCLFVPRREIMLERSPQNKRKKREKVTLKLGALTLPARIEPLFLKRLERWAGERVEGEAATARPDSPD
jgi:hypothetical protein